MNRQKGFTLIEFLIVVAIIGIVASILTARSPEYRAEHARDSAPAIEFAK